MKKIKNIFYINTVYSLLIALMLKPNLEENLYFFNDDFSEEIIKNFKNKIILRKYRKKIKILRYYKIRSFLKKIIKNYKKELLGKDFFMQDHLTFSQFFLNNFDSNFYLVEDGAATNYNLKVLEEAKSKKNKSFFYNYTYFIKKYYPPIGLSSKIRKIYLTGLLPIPESIEKKVEIVKIKSLLEKISEKEKIKILNIFNLNLNKIENLINIKNKILLITQPLSEDGIITEKEKIEIYKEIIKKNNFDKIYIKPHPREKTDYKKIFSEYGVQIIEKNFPLELLNFLQIKFIKIITIFSTAAFNFKDSCEIEFIGTENYPKLYKKFGKIEFKERN